MFQSIGRRGNYANAGRVAADDLVRSFAAARRNSTDFGKIAQSAETIRSNEKVAAIKRGSEVLKAGISAASRVNSEKQQIKINDTIKQGKRKAGALAAAGQMLGNAGQYFGEKRTKRTVGAEDSYYDGRIATLKGKAADYREQAEAIDLTGNFPTIEIPDSSTSSTSSTSSNSSTSGTSQPSSGSAPISSFQATGGKKGKYSVADMANFAQQAGFSPEQARIMGAIGMGESGGNPTIDTVASGLDPNRTNEYSVGLFQINAQAHGDKLAKLGYTSDDLRDPVKSAKVAKMVYDEVGSFKPWSVYTKGIYQQYL